MIVLDIQKSEIEKMVKTDKINIIEKVNEVIGEEWLGNVKEISDILNRFKKMINSYSKGKIDKGKENKTFSNAIDSINNVKIEQSLPKKENNKVRENDNKGKGEKISLNTILYGPPGTGKTYAVAEKALEIIIPKKYKQIKGNRADVMRAYDKLREQNRIAFCTFHQSFAYEDFVEGLRSDEEGKFILQDGIFKRICEAATLEKKGASRYDFDESTIQFYKMSLGNTQGDDGEGVYDYCIENNYVAIGWGGDIDYKECQNRQEIKNKFDSSKPKDKRRFNIDAINRFKNWLKKDDIIFISEGNHKIRAVAKVIGDYQYIDDSEIEYKHFREVKWLYHGKTIGVNQILKEKVLSQQSIYRFSKEDLKIEQIKRFLTKPVEETDNYVLIIDEINRGNISKIFGELITLIEDDKRIDSSNKIIVDLPYSKEPFGIPNNLYIIGTMNTADRSISMMDTALRRRFRFEELIPQLSLLPKKVGNVEVQKMLEELNERIEFFIDRNHTIGHAYFMKEDLTFDDLVEIMKTKVIPLLQEYFYEDWEKIEHVLGGAGEPNDNSYFLVKEEKNTKSIFKTDLDYDQTIMKYQLVENPSEEAFLNIYKRD